MRARHLCCESSQPGWKVDMFSSVSLVALLPQKPDVACCTSEGRSWLDAFVRRVVIVPLLRSADLGSSLVETATMRSVPVVLVGNHQLSMYPRQRVW